MNRKIITLNATLIFVIATLWQQSLHELAHFISAIAFHSKDISIYHNYVQHDTSAISLNARVMIAAAGPLFSLILGFVFQLLCASFSKRNLLFLFCLYMSAFGYINFGGYLMISPFFKGGDTGFVFHSLGLPVWLIILFSIAGVAFLFFSMKMLSRYFVEMASAEIIRDKPSRRKFIASLIEFPLYIGIVVNTLLNLPVVTALSLIYPIFSPFTLYWGFGYLLGKDYPLTHANKEMDKLNKLSPILLVAFILTVICNRVLVHGIHFPSP